MGGRARPTDNAFIDRLWRPLTYRLRFGQKLFTTGFEGALWRLTM